MLSNDALSSRFSSKDKLFVKSIIIKQCYVIRQTELGRQSMDADEQRATLTLPILIHVLKVITNSEQVHKLDTYD